MTRTVLHIDASARLAGSVSRELSARLADRLSKGARIVRRDLAVDPAPFVDEAWVGANFTPEEGRSPEQRAALAGSDALVDELEAAGDIVIGAPIYNFAIPASLKAWIDQVARARRTFRYAENGPEGLLKGKTAWVVIASGGTRLDSEIDFATGYLRHVLGFLGITDVRVIDAARWGAKSDEAKAEVYAGIDAAGNGERASHAP